MPDRGGKVQCGPGLIGNLRINRRERGNQADMWGRWFQAEEAASAKALRWNYAGSVQEMAGATTAA